MAQEQQIALLTGKMHGNEVLIAQHLHKTFRRPRRHKQALLLGRNHYAVKSVSLAVHEGEICGVAGHNGAGKSTSLGLITGSVPLDRPGYRLFASNKFEKENVNNAWVAGHSVREEVGAIRRTLGYCPQFNTNVFQELTVR